MRVDIIETFEIIKGNSNYGRHFFSIFLLELKIYCQDRFQKLSLLTNGTFLLIDWFGFFVLWHINLCRLFNANSILLEEQ